MITDMNMTLDEYQAEQKLKKLESPEHKREKREMRKLQKQKRAELLAQIDQLEKQRCDKCKSDILSEHYKNCNCRANKEVQRIGQELNMLKADLEKTESSANEYAGYRKEDLTVELYNNLKKAKWSDKQIVHVFEWNLTGLVRWKTANGLISPGQGRNKKAKAQESEDNDNQSESDPGQAIQYPIMTEEWVYGVDFANGKDFSVYSATNHEKEIADAQKALNQKDLEISRLREVERAYRDLEVDLLNERTRNKALKKDLEDLKGVAELNLLLMRHHLIVMDKIDNYVGGE